MKTNLLLNARSPGVRATLLLTAGLAGLAPARATWVEISSLSFSYCQSFDGLPNSGGSFTWYNDNTGYTPSLLGWLAESGGGAGAAFNNGSTALVGPVGSTPGLYSYGSGTATDRSLGVQPGAAPGNFAYGVLFHNNTASTINSLSLSYTGEQWYRAASGTAQTLQMSYAVSTSPYSFFNSASGIVATLSPTVSSGTAVENGSGPNANWISAPGGNFTSPVTGELAGVLNGNLAGNQSNVSTVLTGVNLGSGDYIFIRFLDPIPVGGAQGLAIDNFCLNSVSTSVPEAGSWRAAGALALFAAVGAWRARVQWSA